MYYIDSIVSLFRQGIAGDNRQEIEQSKSSHRKEISRTVGGVVRRHDARGRQRCRSVAQQFISIFSQRHSRRRDTVAGVDRNVRRLRDENAHRLHVITDCSGCGVREGACLRGEIVRNSPFGLAC